MVVLFSDVFPFILEMGEKGLPFKICQNGEGLPAKFA